LFVPGFVEVDQIPYRLLGVGMGVAEFEATAFEGFEREQF
jgi:hypothetical protein